MSEKEIIKTNFIDLSSEYLLAILFPESKSPKKNEAVFVAQSARHYKVFEEGKVKFHFCAYMDERSDLNHAMALLDYVQGWNGTKVFVRGSTARPFYVRNVLHCYEQARRCNEPKAYCTKELDGLTNPCQIIFGHVEMVEMAGGISLDDRIEAAGIKMDCNWCPFFPTAHGSETNKRSERSVPRNNSLSPLKLR